MTSAAAMLKHASSARVRRRATIQQPYVLRQKTPATHKWNTRRTTHARDGTIPGIAPTGRAEDDYVLPRREMHRISASPRAHASGRAHTVCVCVYVCRPPTLIYAVRTSGGSSATTVPSGLRGNRYVP